MTSFGGRQRAMVFLPEIRAFPAESFNLDRLLGESNVLVNRINTAMDISNQEHQLSSTSQPFCTFCLRSKPSNVEFYKHVVGSSAELRKSLQALLGYDFRLEDFALCKPCWKIMQLIQDFRLRCLKANKLVERRSVRKGLPSPDGWFSARNLAFIENIRMVVKDQLKRIEQVDVVGVAVSKVAEVDRGRTGGGVSQSILANCEVKIEPREVDVSAKVLGTAQADFGKKLKQVHTNIPVEAKQKTTLDIAKIKSEPGGLINSNYKEVVECINLDSEDSNSAEQFNTANATEGRLETTIDVEDVKVDPDFLILSVELERPPSPVEDFAIETDTDDWEDEASDSSSKPNESGLFQCKKCNRMFESTGFKLHVPICDGTLPARIYSCPECPITFTKHHKLVAHKNKHAGVTPYKCRKNCERGFASAAVRNRHENRCGKDVQTCMFCEKQLDNRLRLYEHYRLVHPEEKKFSCTQCDKRFKRKEHLQCHEKRMHSSDRSRDLVCKVCDKTFVEKQNLHAHMKVHSDVRPFQCDQCGKQLKVKHSLDLHMASKHPELASEYGRNALARMQNRYKEISSQRKLEKRVLKKRGPKPKKRKEESEEEFESESFEDYTEESDDE